MAVIPPDIFSNAEALNQFFDPDKFDSPVLGIATCYDSPVAHTPRAGLHSHSKGQLTFTRQGCTHIELCNQICIIPPYRAVWIPAHTLHKTVQHHNVEFRSIYLDMNEFPQLPAKIEVMSLSPLLKELVERIAFSDFETNWFQDRQYNLLQVFIDEICAAPRQPMLLPLPQDSRMKPLLDILKQQALPPQLQKLSSRIGASERTICRIFSRETGMNYRSWRQQWRLMRSLELMSNRVSLSTISSTLEFNSDSAFVAFFKQYTGTTPGSYIQELRC